MQRLAVLLLLFVSSSAIAQMTDIVHLKNGDRMTGAISEMNLGEMRFETRSMGFVNIKWEDVAEIETNKSIQFETSMGARFFGTPSHTEDGELAVRTRYGETVLGLEEVVHFQRIKADRSVWEAMDKDLRAGFSFTRSSDVMRWNIGAGLVHKSEKFRASLSLDTMVTNNGQSGDSRRANITAGFQRYSRDRYFWFSSGSVQTNDDMGIDRRFLLTAGAGRYVFQKRSTELMLALGLAGNREQSTGDAVLNATQETNLEGLLQMDWTYFKLHTPSSKINTSLELFPGITDSGRNRANLGITFKQEFIKDLSWNVEFWASYDSRPPPGALSGEDYGIVTSIEFDW